MTWLVRLFPPEWQARYGDEFEALLEQEHLSLTDTVNIVVAAFDAWQHRVDAQSFATGSGMEIAPSVTHRSGGSVMILTAGLLVLVHMASIAPPVLGVDRKTLYSLVGWLSPFIFLMVNGGIARSFLFARELGRDNRILALALVSTTIGNVLLLAVNLSRFFPDTYGASTLGFQVGYQLFWLGSGLYAIGLRRAGLLRHWASIPLILTTVGMTLTIVISIIAFNIDLNQLETNQGLFAQWFHRVVQSMIFPLVISFFLVGLALKQSEQGLYSVAQS